MKINGEDFSFLFCFSNVVGRMKWFQFLKCVLVFHIMSVAHSLFRLHLQKPGQLSYFLTTISPIIQTICFWQNKGQSISNQWIGIGIRLINQASVMLYSTLPVSICFNPPSDSLSCAPPLSSPERHPAADRASVQGAGEPHRASLLVHPVCHGQPHPTSQSAQHYSQPASQGRAGDECRGLWHSGHSGHHLIQSVAVGQKPCISICSTFFLCLFS